MDNCATQSAAPIKPWLFTKANAKEQSAKALKARWHTPKPQPIPSEDDCAKTALPKDSFIEQTISRVRKQMSVILDAMIDEDEPALIDKHASALARLAEIERQMSGRPMPGSLKPAPIKSVKSRSTHAIPTVIEPAELPQSAADEPNG